MDIAITKGQKKILLYVVTGIVIIFLFWIFVYLPSCKQMHQYKSQLVQLNERLSKVKMIAEVKEGISKGQTYTQSIEILKNNLAMLHKIVALEEGPCLKFISTAARQLNIEIVSIRPAAKELLLDKNENRIKLAGADCMHLPVNLKLNGNYEAIGNYIERLGKEAPSLITIENLTMEKADERGKLSADISLVIYIKSANTALAYRENG